MELFIPSLLILVLSAVVVFLVLPKASPYVLGGLAIAMLIFGVVQHYQQFPYEYTASSISQVVTDYSPFVILAVLILGILSVLASAFGFQTPSVAAVMPELPAMPAMPAMPNLGGGNGSNKGGVMGGIANTLGLGGNNRPANNKGGMLGGLANTLGLGGNNAKRNNGGGLLGNRFTTV
jgi:hypothetical protein